MNSPILPELPNVTIIRKGITRILAQNPGPFTLQGTNTYLIASEKSSVLIDTGEGKPAYLGFLEPVLRAHPPVSDIILSHWHHDHVGGLPSVLKLIHHLQNSHHLISTTSHSSSHPQFKLPNVWKFKSPTNSTSNNSVHHHDQTSQVMSVKHDQEIHQQILKTFNDCCTIDDHRRPSNPPSDHQQSVKVEPKLNWLSDRQVFQLSLHLRLEILHTPGHTDDSISCLLYDDEEILSNKDDVLQLKQPSAILVGDTILGGSSTIFEDLVLYLKSLQRLLHVINLGNHPSSDSDTKPLHLVPLYSAHGPIIPNGAQSIQQFISHRLAREKEILQIFHQQNRNKSPSDSDYYLTAEKLVELIYRFELPKEVFPAAVHGINQHLKKLKQDGFIDQLESDPRLWFLKTRVNYDE